MMSYLWILLIGSLLASHARAQEEGDLAPTASDPVAEEVPVVEEPEVDTEADNTATEEPQVEDEAVPDADPAEVEEAVIPMASDPKVEDEEPTAAEEEDEEDDDDEEEDEEADTVADDTADDTADAPAAEDLGITTEAPADESDEILTTVEPADGSDEILTTVEPADESDEILTTVEPADESDEILTTIEPADESDNIITTVEPETEEDVEATTPVEEAEVPKEGSAETSTPTPIIEQIVTTTVRPVVETSTTTQAANPVVIDEEAKQTTTTTGVKEVPLNTRAPAEHKEITTTAEVSGEEETPVSIIRQAAEDLKSEVIQAIKHAGTRMGFGRDTSSEVPAVGASGEDPSQSGEGSSKPLAAVLSGIVVAAVGAVAAYFTYQKKKLCFKKKQESDPEAGNKVEKVDPADAQSNPETLAPLVEKH